jgi:DNA polymerase alpha-associated DNA helicase A
MPSETDISTFATTQISLLQAELDAELAESSAQTSTLPPTTLQRAGAAILNLCLSSTRTGLGGKTVLNLEPDSAYSSSQTKDGSLRLPEHGIRVGDVVRVQTMVSGSAKKREKSEAENAGCAGVVSKVGESIMAVALDKEDVDIPQGRLWMYVLYQNRPQSSTIVVVFRINMLISMLNRVKLANDITYKRYAFLSIIHPHTNKHPE